MIVRPAEPAWPKPRTPGGMSLPDGTPKRMVDTMTEAKNIVAWTADDYGDAVRDWAANGADSRFVMSASDVVARSGSRDSFTSTAAAHFALAEHLERSGDHSGAVHHFREAHRLAPVELDLQAPSVEHRRCRRERPDGAVLAGPDRRARGGLAVRVGLAHRDPQPGRPRLLPGDPPVTATRRSVGGTLPLLVRSNYSNETVPPDRQ